ncbi:LamG domain-containing protein [Fulvivirga sp. RKSG066]|uniref:LamG domain-containing protein n=1 Tax=Fulvivirga aurantia TaxID=2529383 RepID=UPI0012BC6E79|nr:LamG domain-containing protein [Fulvivirga aurantia]MTI22940.1 LamG domain-containing protein [Fulvivirga aurantia]
MRKLQYILILLLCVNFACDEEYIDDISRVELGSDQEEPDVSIKFPTEGLEIPSYDAVIPINIQFEVTDDIEVQSITITLDGESIVSFNDFLDYRVVKEEYTHESLTDGEHTLEVTATDISGKSTTTQVTFAKVPPYIPEYDGEIFYMPFDGANLELITGTTPTIVGSPGFADEGKVGGNAYAGASDSYLTFPTEGLLNSEFSATFWMKVNATPDRAGILVIGPTDETNPEAQNNRTSGFRFFRENAGGKQRFKLNVGNGEGDNWFDGGNAADIDPTLDEWRHFSFTISGSQATVYIDGEVVSQGTFPGVDWTDTDIFSIMSGAPRFTGWGHLSDQSFMDELRLFNKELSQAEIQTIIDDEGGTIGYTPEFGEIFYMPFEDDYVDVASGASASEVGTSGFAGEGLRGDNAYAGATDSYLTFPSESFENGAFSASFWYKLNATPDRAGILVIGPPDDANPDAQNVRTSGFRFFREDAGGDQRFKLNVGTGASDVWFDGADAADLNPATETDWVHIAFSISDTEATVYIDGVVVSTNTFAGIDWTDCDILSIGSGAPRFTGWGHKSDLSYIDELRIFDRPLSLADVEAIIAAR